mmetsp:Transcript_15638/g.32658  ORF Transcript_15638/g.32658 Transcript_15638/m.32658 type:complete len:107 (-) Transcript_15638:78-398(-)
MITQCFHFFSKAYYPPRLPVRRNFSTKPPHSTAPQTKKTSIVDSQKPNPSIWGTLRAPALFGIGLYLGLMAFGEHHETKVESQNLSQMRALVYKNSDTNGGKADNR